ncbi:GlsB/YeaQ/YmgE family stress response membrane protein [Streptococcaceae bacterium ESL0687]|nr:GlsB/YeaQ/YmgE family stress response membrane protein [Streptococcaceae bacterium ESL0687]
MIWSLIIGALIGLVAGKITNQSDNMGVIYKIFAGLAGSFIGQRLFGDGGFKLAGMAVIPSIIGAVILIIVISYFTDRRN